MFVAMNRFRIAPGREAEFTEIWRSRDSHLKEVPGFVSFHLLQGASTAESTLFASHTVWASRQAFEDWTRSEAFRRAHAGAGGSRDLYRATSTWGRRSWSCSSRWPEPAGPAGVSVMHGAARLDHRDPDAGVDRRVDQRPDEDVFHGFADPGVQVFARQSVDAVEALEAPAVRRDDDPCIAQRLVEQGSGPRGIFHDVSQFVSIRSLLLIDAYEV